MPAAAHLGAPFWVNFFLAFFVILVVLLPPSPALLLNICFSFFFLCRFKDICSVLQASAADFMRLFSHKYLFYGRYILF